MLTALIAVLLAALAILNARTARSFLYPPAIFAGYWAALLLGVSLSGSRFYPISEQTLTIYTLGTISFSVGGYLTLTLLRANGSYPPRPALADRRRVAVGRLLDVGLLALVAVFPFYLARIRELSAISGVSSFWLGLRYQTSVVEQGQAFGLFAYVGPFATFLAWAACYEHDGRRGKPWRPAALIALALAYHVLSTARTGALQLLFGLIGIAWLRAGRTRAKPTILSLAGAIVMFSAVAIVVGKGASADASLGDNVRSLSETLRLYQFGGVVAFDRYVQGYTQLEPGLRTLRFFAAFANAFGARLTMPSLVLDFTGTPQPTNVYTMYLPFYADYGWAGIAILPALVGGLTTAIYHAARRGHRPAAILYGVVFASILLTAANDTFFAAISFWLQIACYATALYGFPLLRRRQLPTVGATPARQAPRPLGRDDSAESPAREGARNRLGQQLRLEAQSRGELG